ncbi:MAG: knotted carbamoyltransferase YgeW [Spirochaetes bacterium GWD1_61_31]|nr:MAG: knotted carbamoyltransferase YgeW [Spirochaetes bacterium GWB1_60_80]OHD40560.1 MAG: knotted carbamoyltransferase YgeW [Spirochaetes bacterium GWD1_61_31]OHD44061.1 MAG: knotted carbamoyltransferase YgeW [Spirochaetes bacterium GWE1_60_18]OHD59095.1 MAG: knotted carbamoyltransferase YgeW [Spirochaetes bacterium GWF1_60_12]HAP44540.1 knotted carbamoyltransferase YgeW [Spirochaetaceae bacterium]
MGIPEIKKMIADLSSKKIGMFHKDFLLTWEKSADELQATFLVADILRAMRVENVSPRLWHSGIAVSNFRDNSTRTRFSYASACDLLGLYVQDLDEGKSQIAHGETVRETANMISFLSEAIGIRDDMYLGEGDKYQREVAKSLDEGVASGVLPDRPTVVNLQSDIDHPTQSMADLLHLAHHFGGLDKLKGKKIAMTWAYSPSYGKPLSVPQGIIGLASRFGMQVSLAHPEGYGLIPEVVELSKKQATTSGGSFQHVNSMEEAFQDADIVYPKSWAPYHVMQQRVPLLHANDQAGLKDLEKQCLANNAKFLDWECTEAKMKLTKGGKALYMHCLPADITGVSCKAGEVAESVFDRYRDDTYREASYKPYIIAAMILLGKRQDPAATLGQLLERAHAREIL